MFFSDDSSCSFDTSVRMLSRRPAMSDCMSSISLSSRARSASLSDIVRCISARSLSRAALSICSVVLSRSSMPTLAFMSRRSWMATPFRRSIASLIESRGGPAMVSRRRTTSCPITPAVDMVAASFLGVTAGGPLSVTTRSISASHRCSSSCKRSSVLVRSVDGRSPCPPPLTPSNGRSRASTNATRCITFAWRAWSLEARRCSLRIRCLSSCTSVCCICAAWSRSACGGACPSTASITCCPRPSSSSIFLANVALVLSTSASVCLPSRRIARRHLEPITSFPRKLSSSSRSSI
mmetsp:Transcript_4644/g.10623  ORF Transcript_4644/g.10623 Transcript_4644/m.10623 type:complete len:294 (+) Transcript_4644:1240-2121(+)